MVDVWDEDLDRGRPMETGCWRYHASKQSLNDSGHGSDQIFDPSNDMSSVSSESSASTRSKLDNSNGPTPSGKGRSIRGRQHLQSTSLADIPSAFTQFVPVKPPTQISNQQLFQLHQQLHQQPPHYEQPTNQQQLSLKHPFHQQPPHKQLPHQHSHLQQHQQSPAQPPKDATPYIPPEPSEDEAEMFRQGISSGIHFEEYDKIPVNVTGVQVPPPIDRFADARLSPDLLQNVQKSGYNRPTPVQKNAIPVILARRDLMACAQTGSGKTAAFLLPIIEMLMERRTELVIGEPQVVIITPTRELTIQIFKEARKFAIGSRLKMCIVYGGTLSTHQRTNVAKGCHILLATPGRLSDFVSRGYVSFASLQFLVLDEADRMLNLGFLPIIEKLICHPSMVEQSARQTIMSSATFPPEIQRLAGRFLVPDYIFLAVGVVGGACADVRQNVIQVGRFDKRKKLLEILNENDPSGTMVFVKTRQQADFLASFLSESRHPTTSIHGDRLQRQREEALADFMSNTMKVLIATSVAARGLDIRNVTHVINFDLPKDVDEYVHRIGRTGRVGNRGIATSFYDPDADSSLAPDLVKILQQANQEVPQFLLNVNPSSNGSVVEEQDWNSNDY